MNLLNKIHEYVKHTHEFECEKCSTINDKKNLMVVHSNFCALGPQEKKRQYLCVNCFNNHIKEKFTKFNSKAAFFYPIQRFEYTYFPLDAINAFVKGDEKKERFIKNVKMILPDDKKLCHKCHSNNAQISWCSDSVFNEDDPWEFDESILKNTHVEHLCPECFSEIFIEYLKEYNITNLDMFDILGYKDGFCMAVNI